jgi:aspartate aminotransferase
MPQPLSSRKATPAPPPPEPGQRLAAIPPSATIAVGGQVRALRAQGIDVVNLGGGAPDPAAPWFGKPLSFAKDRNVIGDPFGEADLRAAIAAKLKRDQGLVYDPAREIVVTIGAKQALYAALLALIEPGDEVAVLDPAWVTYGPSVRIAGGVPRLFALDRADGFRLDAAALARVIGPRTRVVVVNTPHNPTGRVFTAAELEAVAEVARRHGLWVISDESFDKFVFDNHRHISLAALPDMRERTVVLQSFSKAYAMIGARVGYLAAPPAVAGAVARFNEQVLSCVSPLLQSLALDALAADPDWTARLRAHYREKRDVAVAGLRAVPGFACAVPEGTFYVLADVSSFGRPAADFAARLLNEARVATTPGSAFGQGGEGYLRFNLAGPLDTIREGLARIQRAFARGKG